MERIQRYRVTLKRDGVLRVAERHCGSFDESENVARAYYEARRPPHEEMIAILVNGRNDVIGLVTIGVGGAHGCALTPGDVLRPVIAAGAAAFVLVHNHPSGDATPSPEDLTFTAHMDMAAKTVGIPMLDHMVIAFRGDGSTRAVSVLETLRC